VYTPCVRRGALRFLLIYLILLIKKKIKRRNQICHLVWEAMFRKIKQWKRINGYTKALTTSNCCECLLRLLSEVC
jgi:hypothetical protein